MTMSIFFFKMVVCCVLNIHFVMFWVIKESLLICFLMHTNIIQMWLLMTTTMRIIIYIYMRMRTIPSTTREDGVRIPHQPCQHLPSHSHHLRWRGLAFPHCPCKRTSHETEWKGKTISGETFFCETECNVCFFSRNFFLKSRKKSLGCYKNIKTSLY